MHKPNLGRSFDVIVYVDASHYLTGVKDTLQSLSLQNPLPNKVAVILDNPSLNPDTVWEAIAEMALPYEWFMRVMEEKIDIPETVDRLCFVVDDVIRGKLRGDYYSVFGAGTVVRKDFLNRLTETEKSYYAVLPYDINAGLDGLTIRMNVHRYFGGNGESTVVEKLISYAEELQQDTKILNFADLSIDEGVVWEQAQRENNI